MPSLKEVKNRISSVISTQQITKAMKMVAAAKLRRSQERITQMRPFAERLSTILQNLSSADSGDLDNWYSRDSEVKSVLIITISSDRGLCGSFNSNIFKATNKLIREKYAAQNQAGAITILPLGRKAFDYFKKQGYPMIDAYVNIFQNLSFEEVSQIAENIMTRFQALEFDRVELIYNQFKNVATQILKTEQFLPVLSIAEETTISTQDYIFEPSQEEIASGVIPKSLKVQLFKGLLDSNASENGARMTAMDKATENAGDLLKELRLSYNRTRQAAITKEILEIVGGAEALKSS